MLTAFTIPPNASSAIFDTQSPRSGKFESNGIQIGNWPNWKWGFNPLDRGNLNQIQTVKTAHTGQDYAGCTETA
jgi:hypothetical protein